MKKLLSILLLSIILFGCSKDPLKKSVIEPLEMYEIKKILEFQDKNNYYGFDFFYERVQEFHELTKNDNLTKVKFENVLYQHYFDDSDYLHNSIYIDKIIMEDSILRIVNQWETIQKYVNIYDTLSSVIETRERYKSYGFYSDKEIKVKTKGIMKKYIQDKIETSNSSLWELYKKGKSENIILFDEFNSKRIDLIIKNRKK